MVRLRVRKRLSKKISGLIFQFLNGTIKSLQSKITCDRGDIFQFLNGTIKREYTMTLSARLEQFQFLNGTIKSGSGAVTVAQKKAISIPKWYD